MATCPLCLFASPAGTTVCGRCGRFRFPSEVDSAEIEASDSSAMRTLRGTMTVVGAPAGEQDLSQTPPPTAPRARNEAGSGSGIGAGSKAKITPEPVSNLGSRLVVIRGVRIGVEFPVYDGKNYIGRSADKPVDIDLNGLEPAEQVWASRQHAVITCQSGNLVIEDLNSLNGTFVNRARIHPGQQRQLLANDVVQVGTVQFRVVT